MHLLYVVRFYRGFSFFIEAVRIFPQKAVFSVPADAHKRNALQHTARSGQSEAGAFCQSAHLRNKNTDDCASHPSLWDRRISVGYACIARVYGACCRDSHLPHSTQIKKSLHILQAYRNMCRLIKLQIIHVKGTHLFLYQS